MFSSKAFLLVLTALLGVLALSAPLHLLLLARFPLVMLQGEWSPGGVRINAVDLVLGFLLVALVLRGSPKDEDRRRWPYVLPWMALGVMLSASYLNAPINQENLTAFHRIAYQLYRYCWKGILFYPLALLVLKDRVKVEHAALAIVVAGDLLAFQGTVQGYVTGEKATGPLSTGNELAGCLVAPFVLSLIGFLVPQTRFRLFWIASSLLMLRALLFSGSRGGLVAAVAGVCFCGAWLMTRASGRARIVRLAPPVIVLAALVLVAKPDLLERPTIRRAISARQGLEASTMQWRMQERWPYFIGSIAENPWLGVGTAVDEELAFRGGAPTPHNGYLAIAVAHGLPVAALYALLALLTVVNGLRIFMGSEDPWESALGLVLAGGLVGVLVHNLVEASLRLAFTRDLFWMTCALCAVLATQLRAVRREVKAPPARALAQRASR